MKVQGVIHAVVLVLSLSLSTACLAAGKAKQVPIKKDKAGKPILTNVPPEVISLINAIEGNHIKKPTKLSEMNGANTDVESYSVAEASDLGFAFGSLEQAFNRRFFVKNYIVFRSYTTTNGVELRYGMGIRWVVNLKLIDVNARINGLPYVAAGASFNTVEASSQFQVVGLSHPKIPGLVNSVTSSRVGACERSG